MSGRKRIYRVAAVLAIAVASGQGVEHIRESNRASSAAIVQAQAPLPADDASKLRGITSVASTTDPAQGGKCSVSMVLGAAPSAMINLSLASPCARGERVVIRYSDISFTTLTGADGTLRLQLPALERETLVAAYFEGSAIALAKVTVPDIGDFVRFGVEMPFPAKFDLRAMEGDTLYVGSSGTVPRDATSRIHTLGAPAVSDRIISQVYTFSGLDMTDSALSVEVRITEETCGQTLPLTAVLSRGGVLESAEHRISVPLCGTSGDILVLKNLLHDLRLAVPN